MKYSQKANLEWKGLLVDLLSGDTVSPQQSAGAAGRKSRELLSWQTMVDMNYPVVTNVTRALNYKFMCAEAHWILAGDNRVETIRPYCRNIAKYSDDGETFYGAYGPEIYHQFEYARDVLLRDPNSRQAVISIWKRNPVQSKDIPCTLSSQFVIRKNRLHIIQTMRSSDAWLGWPYDIFNFSMLGAYMALHLRSKYKDLLLGDLCLTAGSQHVYEDHFEKAREAVGAQTRILSPIILDEFSAPGSLIKHLEGMKNGVDFGESNFLKDVML